MYRVFDLYGDGEPRDWSADLKELYAGLQEEAEKRRKKSEPERVSDAPASLPLEEYVGTYSDPLYSTASVDHSDGLTLTYGRFSGKLEHWHYDTFRVHWKAKWRGTAFVTFQLNGKGKPETLKMYGATLKREE